MNKTNTFKKALLTFLISGLSFFNFSQIIMNEGFEGDGMPAGWITLDEDGEPLDNWVDTSMASYFSSYNGNYPAFKGDKVAASFSWTSSVAYTPDNWLITPAITITDPATELSFRALSTFGTSQGGSGDYLEVYISTTGTATTDFTTTLFDKTFSVEEWEKVTVSLAAYVGDNVHIAFRHYNSTDQWMMALDEITVATPYTDLDLTSMSDLSEFTSVPESQTPSTLTIRSGVANAGNQDISSYSLNTFIYLAPDYTTPIKTFSTPGTDLLVDSTATIEVGTYDVSAAGTYLVRNIASAPNDVISNNDTLERTFTVSPVEYARDLGTNDASGVSMGDSTNAVLGTTYDFTKAVLLDSVMFMTELDTVGGKLQVQIYKIVNNVVDSVNVYGQSADIDVDQAFVDNVKATGVASIYVPVTKTNGDPLVLLPGSYFVGVHQDSLIAAPFGMGLQMSSGVLSLGALMGRFDDGAFFDLYFSGVQFFQTPILRAYVSEYTGPVITSSDTDNTICSNETVTLTSSAATGNVWSPGGETTQSIEVSVGGTYSVTVDGTASEEVVVTVLVADEPNTSGTSPTSCGGTDGSIDISLPAPGTGTLYWSGTATGNQATTGILESITNLGAGGYIVTYDNGTGCLSSEHAVLLSDPGATNPTIAANGATTFCAGDSVRLGSSAIGGNTWSTTETTDSITVMTSGNYFVTNNTGGCFGVSNAIEVTMNALPTVGAGVDVSICVGQDVTLSGSGASSYVWDGGVTDGVAISPVATGDYIVTGTDGNGCVNTDTVTVVVGNPPSVTFDALQPTCVYDSETALVAVPTGGEFTGPGVAGTVFNPAGLAAGGYTITYTVTVDGCDGQALQTIVVDSCLSLSDLDQERLSVYPNPSNGQFTVASDNLNDYDVIELHDQLGRVVGSWKINQVSMNIEAEDIKRGNYLLVIRGEKGTLVRKISLMD